MRDAGSGGRDTAQPRSQPDIGDSQLSGSPTPCRSLYYRRMPRPCKKSADTALTSAGFHTVQVVSSSALLSSSSSSPSSASPSPPSVAVLGMRAGVRATCGVIILTLVKVSLWAELLLLRGVGSEDTSAGFTVSRVPGLNLLSLQCNGSNLPNNARSIQNMVLERHPAQSEAPSIVIATLSSVDGVVRLENPKNLEHVGGGSSVLGSDAMLARRRKSDIYVGGRFVVDDAQQTSLSILLGPSTYDALGDAEGEAVVRFGCEISYTKKSGRTAIIRRFLNVSFAELESLYQVQPPHSLDSTVNTEGESAVAASTSSASRPKQTTSGSLLDTPMILLITMAILLFFLFVICVLLIVDRCQGNRRQRQRATKSYRKRGGAGAGGGGGLECPAAGGEVGIGESTTIGGGAALDKGEERLSRPLPPPPAWTYPQVMGAPPPRSPYNRLRQGQEGSYLRDDTGYDSDASMHYSRPFDDLGATIQEKPQLQTFGKRLPPLYASSPSTTK